MRIAKTLTAILFGAMLLMAGTIPATAQHMQGEDRPMMGEQTDTTGRPGMMGMMKDEMSAMMPCPMMPSHMGMMQGMMQSQMGMMRAMHMQMMERAMKRPLKHSAMMVRVLPTMKDPLGLSDAQVAHLEELAARFKEAQSELAAKASEVETKLDDQLASDEPDPAEITTLLREEAMHRADMKALGIKTAMQMKADLTGEQREKLAAMTPVQMHQHMASHMTMMEMMQAMHGDDMPGSSMGVRGGSDMQMEMGGGMKKMQ